MPESNSTLRRAFLCLSRSISQIPRRLPIPNNYAVYSDEVAPVQYMFLSSVMFSSAHLAVVNVSCLTTVERILWRASSALCTGIGLTFEIMVRI